MIYILHWTVIVIEQYKLFSKESFLLIPLGILLNIACAKLVLALQLPIFLDSIGTILVSALGGPLPGVTVGFFSNAINSIGDPITLYYGLISILIAFAAVFCSRAGLFTRFPKALLSSLLFALIGGALGSLLTWMLYGLNMGSGISAPLALRIQSVTGATAFLSQLTADVAIDVVDKAITLTVVFLLLRILPNRLLDRLPYGSIYRRAGKAALPGEGNGPDGT